MSDFLIEYKGDLSTEIIHTESSSKISTDAPKDNNGLGRKFSPTDLVASSLGSCLLTIMGIVAKRHKIDMDGSHARIRKTMSESPRMISKIDVDIFMKSNLSEKDINLLKNVSKHCPVHNSLSNSINIIINFK